MDLVFEPPRAAPVTLSAERSFVVLDGLRGIAALCVAAGHARFLVAGPPVAAFSESYLAVDFFFLLSGFVLEHAYGASLRSGMTVRRFVALRLIRLYPLYLLALLLSALLAVVQARRGPAGDSPSPGDWLCGLMLVPSPFSHDALFPINIPAWSLFFELIANFAFALAGRRLRTGIVACVVASAAIALMPAICFGWLGFGGGSGAMDVGVNWPSIAGGMLRVTFSFFAGVLVYRVWQRRPMRLPVVPIMPATLLLAVLIAYPAASYHAVFDLVATLAVFPVLVFLGAGSAPGRHLANALRWLGAISFGVYVLQMFAYSLVRWVVAAGAGGSYPGLPVTGVIGAVGLLTIAATALDAWYDRPIRRQLKEALR